ncbi:diguanylate cyclase (GGDEF)-like protein [Sphingomonas sp. BE138]|uniref:putative bifunctional diguanylate cyclase/phosphodiesterase n=1 Tax=Sphingomonas sp. BE138 TaxID=2817845 RepID=UPI0028573DA3|nr:EAL domain-containing protein [Sphingomonas sp. BE138]MDR6786919.1 diguanylate cyclase (GGDEF)-like protein [Sphingomonas sp. BE138]
MLPTSISTRVAAAFGAVLALGVMLLAGGLVLARAIQSENVVVGQLTTLLQMENRQDQLQRRLRLGVGEVTRLAEQGRPVKPAQWRHVGSALAGFHRGNAHLSPGLPVSADLRAFADARTRAEARFAELSLQLLRDAHEQPAAIPAHMPAFLSALRTLESSRSSLRGALVDRIDVEVRGSSRTLATNLARVLIGAGVVLALLLACMVWLRRRVIRPIAAIAERVRQLSRGEDAWARVPGASRRDELGDLARGIGEYRSAVEERQRAERRAEFLAHHDMLTGLPNRLLFEERLTQELARVRRTGERVAVFAIDLDDFKSINDRFGHAGGDEALRAAAQLLSASVRASDLVARLGGDEFAIIQVGGEQPDAAEALVRRILRACEATAGDTVPVQMSIGVAMSGVEQAGEELYNLADMAMYRAKAEGRHTARFFDDHFKEEVRLRWRLSRDLEGAAERGELYLVFQPIADADTLEVIGQEVLLRWAHPELGEIPPDRFIPLAEASGRIDAIGLWMADHAMAAASRWPDDMTLALNLSAIQFRQPALGHELLALARRHKVAPTRLEFEVTESATLLDNRRQPVLTVLRTLQHHGARIVMDDFGTGYSSLGNLRDFRFDKLKIDRSFVTTMLNHAPSGSIVRSIAALGASLGIPIVAEGVEEEAQLLQLREWAVPQVQGFLVGRPSREALHCADPAALACARPASPEWVARR